MSNLLYDPSSGQMRIAGFMSGSGTNLIEIIEHENKLKKERGNSPYHVAVIFTNNPKSNAVKIGTTFNVPVIVNDLDAFLKRRESAPKDMIAREEYETECMKWLKQYECPVAAYAGYMRKATPVFVKSFLGVNVHPADLTVLNEKGKKKYTGDHAVEKAILAGETQIRSTTHLVAEKVDLGPVLMVSAPYTFQKPEFDRKDPHFDEILTRVAKEYQDKLKEIGDWVIFPRTLEYIADGKFSIDNGKIYFEGKPIPDGIKLE